VTWLAIGGFVSLVRSGVASRVYLLGVDSLGVVRLGIVLTDGGFAGGTPNDLIVFSRLGTAGRALRVRV
jgi:hypothetical protein